MEIQRAFRSLRDLPPPECMASVARYPLRPGVKPQPSPDGPPPPWMAKRPAGLAAFIAAFDKGHLDLASLRSFKRPVYFALGGLSNQDYFGRMAARLGRVFPDFTLETYPERHHFDPPHRIEPAKLATPFAGSGTVPTRGQHRAEGGEGINGYSPSCSGLNADAWVRKETDATTRASQALPLMLVIAHSLLERSVSQ